MKRLMPNWFEKKQKKQWYNKSSKSKRKPSEDTSSSPQTGHTIIRKQQDASLQLPYGHEEQQHDWKQLQHQPRQASCHRKQIGRQECNYHP